jgi:hydrogenase-4 component F
MHWSFLGRPEIAAALEPRLVALSFLFVLVGYGTKAGFAPMHTWLPDVHGEAPSPVSALLSGVLLKSALYAILRFYTISNLNRGSATFTSAALLCTGLLSLVLAIPFILKPNKFKRILAYHSLEHIGIIAFGIGIGGPIALFGALLHALNHALTKALMFLGFEQVRQRYAASLGSADLDERSIRGVLRTMPSSGLILLFGGLGLVGAPPFNLFLSEFIILWAALDKILHPQSALFPPGIYIVAISLFLITITMIFGGLVGHLARLLLDRPAPAFDSIREERPTHLLPLVALLIIITLMGFWIPTWPINFPQLIGQSVCILEQGAGSRCSQ